MDLSFYRDKKVLVTGHTGFKGTWLCKELVLAGAHVAGYALDPPTEPSLYYLSGIGEDIEDIRGDIRNLEALEGAFQQLKPEIVFHLAAQPIVLEGYNNPVLTYDINVMGTVNVLECVRKNPGVRSFVNITTDKVYENPEKGYLAESDKLNGFDPYSNSKACSELVTETYKRSFEELNGVGVVTLRSGNTIGGGDFGQDRIIPDCIRAYLEGKEVIIRNPNSSRPYQHVIEVATAYMAIGPAVWERPELSGAYNIGPIYGSTKTEDLVKALGKKMPLEISYAGADTGEEYKEAGVLELDTTLMENTFGWTSKMTLEEAMDEIESFVRTLEDGGNISNHMEAYIFDYENR